MKRKIYKPSIRSNVSPFYVMNLLEKAKKMELENKKVYHLELGEPQMKTPDLIKDEVQRLVKKGIAGYTPSNGIYPLRKKISEYYKRKYQVEVSEDRVFITTGSSGAFLLSFLLNFDKGDRVAIFNPVYPAYRNILKSLDIEVVEIYPDINERTINFKLIEKYKELDGVIISNPNNPNGQVFTDVELKYIYNFCKKYKIKLISDEIYHGITYDLELKSCLNFGDETIIINSFSKYFCMPGWRLGWVIVPKSLTKNLLKLSQNIFISSGNIAQFAAIKAFECIDNFDNVVKSYKENRDKSLKILEKMPFLEYSIPSGAFYFYVNIKKLKIDSSVFVKKLLNDTGVALTPGIDFDTRNGKKTIRISFSSDQKSLLTGLNLLYKWYKTNY
ncbi:MAG: pyridoxal phosphate-dependent aminotransferase [Alphaproteobacteria bacterium]